MPPRLHCALPSRLRSSHILALCAGLLVLLGFGTTALARRGTPGVSAHSSAADTVIIFGPRRLTAAQGTAHYVEQFTEYHDPEARYVLEVTNGAADGNHRVTDAVVKLNGVVLLTRTDFQSAAAVLSPEIWIADGINTLQVEVKGENTRYLSARVLRVRPPDAPLYRRGFQKAAEQTVTVIDTFATAAAQSTQGRLQIDSGAEDDRVFLNGVRIFPACIRDAFTQCPAVVKRQFDVALQPVNELRVVLNGAAPSTLVLSVESVDTAAPALQIAGPVEGLVTKAMSVEIAGTAVDDTPPVTLTINGDTVPVGAGGAFSTSVPLPSEGENLIRVVAEDAAARQVEVVDLGDPSPTHNRVEIVRRVIRDTRAPVLTLSAPREDGRVRDAAAVVSGSVADLMTVTLNVNGVPFTVDASGSFSGPVALVEGVNFITATATDVAGNSTSVTRQVTLDTQAPVITLSSPTEGMETDADTLMVQGSVVDQALSSVKVNGTDVTVSQAGGFQHALELQPGANTVAVSATDAVGNTATSNRTVTRRASDVRIPPDPAAVATRLDASVATSVADGTAFLYTGTDPIQTRVQPGTIQRARAAVVRGHVRARDGGALPGVRVSVRGHPEYGQTISRADGMFDLAVNGGGQVTLDFERTGYLPAQRQATVPWQNYAATDDVALVPLDPTVTRVELGAAATAIQVARGSVVEDADGRRQATLLFAPGTQAVALLPDGTERPLASGSVRATEVTVGPNGRAAMPGPLPPGVAYTYAVDLSLDEARALNATSVRFSKPVAFYLDNFLEFPVGVRVPAGYYDLGRAAWQPEDNAVVLRILQPEGGLAGIDANGDGAPESEAALTVLGITQEERARIAQLYPPGATVWRGQVSHFSIWDFNPIFTWFMSWLDNRVPDSGNNADGKPPTPDDPKSDDREDDPNCRSGSVIDCENQALGETLSLRGTPLSLYYWSNRTPGYLAGRILTIPLTGGTVTPPAGTHIRIRIEVAGRVFEDSVLAAAGAAYSFLWDGKDVYGRPVQGRQPLRYKVGYVYPQFYTLFTQNCTVQGRGWWWIPISCAVVTSRGREDDVRWTTRVIGVEAPAAPEVWDARGQGWGGWTVGIHHVYDPAGQVLRMGDGQRVSAVSVNGEISNVAGNGFECGELPGTPAECQNGIPATESSFEWPEDVAVGPDGSQYIADWPTHQIRRVGPDGIIGVVAGTGTCGYSGDGGPAVAAKLCQPQSVALGPDGSLYISDMSNNRVRRVTPDGVITTVAGNGNWAYSGDGGPATAAGLEPDEVVVAPDGSVYIADYSNHRIRRVNPDGRIVTVLGNGTCGSNGDGRLAVDARTCYPTGLDLGPDGSLYVANGSRIRRIDPAGMITTLSTTRGMSCWDYRRATGDASCGDGKPVGEVPVESTDVAVGDDGSIYVVDQSEYLIRRISPDGIVTNVAGGGTVSCGYSSWTNTKSGDPGCGNRAAARQVRLNLPSGVTVGPDSKVYFTDSWSALIRRIDRAVPSSSEQRLVVPSKDGMELFTFDLNGRHLRTADALTGARLWEFGYDAAGLLVQVTDGTGQVTRIERTSDGSATAVVGPYGHRTALMIGANGYLRAVTDPGTGAVLLEYTGAGLLASKREPWGASHRFEYNSAGRLVRDEGPDGTVQILSRFATARGVGGVLSSPLGRTNRFFTERLANGAVQHITIDPAGLRSVVERSTDGTVRGFAADGTTTRTVVRGDPRFGMGAPTISESELTTPAGRKLTVFQRRSVQLDPMDRATLVAQHDTLLVNNRVFVQSFDVASRVTSTVSPSGRVVTSLRDSLGRYIETRVPGLLPVERRYDAAGRLATIRQGGRSRGIAYDDAGRVARTSDVSGTNRTFRYDSSDRLVEQVVSGGGTTRVEYDSAGNVILLAAPGQPGHRMEYDAGGRLRSYVPPGVTPDSAARFSYTPDGQLQQAVGLDGRATTFEYDDGGRILRVIRPDATGSITYDPVSGRVVGVASTSGPGMSLTYDGPLPLSTHWNGAVSGSYSVGYDDGFRVKSDSINGAHGIGYEYNLDGRLIRAGAMEVGRDPTSGWMVGTTLGALTTSAEFDRYGGLTASSASQSSSEIYSVSYRRDALGRLAGLTENVLGELTTFAFSRDSAGRLVEVSRNGSVAASYQYDQNGNRTRTVGLGGAVEGVYDAQDRLVSYGAVKYGYTAGGDLAYRALGSDTTRYEYVGQGALRAVKLPGGRSVEYIIDALGRRVGRRIDGRFVQGYLYSGALRVAAELDSTGQVRSRFVYAGRDVPSYMTRGGKTYRLVADHTGSIRLVVEVETGVVVQRLDYDAWGRVERDSNPGFQPFGYGGGLYDPETRLTRFGARDYDAEVGRWTARDPIGFASGETNLYAYVRNDPLTYSDPSGLCPPTNEYLTLLGDQGDLSVRAWADAAEESTGLDRVVAQGMGLLAALCTSETCGETAATLESVKGGIEGVLTNGAAVVSRRIINGHLAGSRHPVTKIPFDQNGFPDFSGVAVVSVDIEFTGNRKKDFMLANKEIGCRSVPTGYTWHHHQNQRTMQLVPKEIHGKTGHLGGFALHRDGDAPCE